MSGAAVPQAALGDATVEVTSWLESNPELAAVLILVVAVAAWGATRALQRFRRPDGARFLAALRDEDAVTVLTHPNPDPDAMGTAAAVAHLAERVGTDATIQYPGEIRHHQNRAFRTVLDLDMDRVRRTADMASESVVLVDHNRPRGFQGARNLEPVAVVDHHPGNGTGEVFTDVRPDYGACASIVAEYLRELDAGFVDQDDFVPGDDDGDVTVPAQVVTGLVYGILSDTDNLTNGASPAEFDASSFLYAGVDQDALKRIANPRVDAESLEVKARAITDRDVRAPYAVSDVGEVSNVDAIPQAASELVNLETVTAVVVYGDDGETIHMSGRSRDDRVHMGKALEEVTDDIPMASAGGHARMGGGQIDIVHMEGLAGNGIDRSQLTERLFTAMGGEEIDGAEPVDAD
ncbi:RNA-binding protein [Halobacteriales archaeon QS_1_68_20]|nr:MAG: RNA-binding protein [Halobacteriales archaeon QS_1_68_20]